MKTLTVNELFSGIGSQIAALERLGIDFKVVGIAEIDKDAILSYSAIHHDFSNKLKHYDFPSGKEMSDYLEKRNIGFDFKKNKPFSWQKLIEKITGNGKRDLKKYYLASVLSNNYGDISKIDKLDYADFWTYSFPCQDISVAGLQRGINENTRSGLLYQVERLIEVAKDHDELPKYLMLENVKNLVGKKFKEQFDEWIQKLDELGYTTRWQVLNAKNYGIPQNRERVFAISIRKDIDMWYEFPEGFDNGIRLKDLLENDVDEKYYISDEKLKNILSNKDIENKLNNNNDTVEIIGQDHCKNEPKIIQKQGDRGTSKYSVSENSYTVPANPMSDRGQLLVEPQVLRPVRNEYGKEIRKEYESGLINESRHNMTEMKPRTDGISNTLTTVQKDNYVVEPQITIDKSIKPCVAINFEREKNMIAKSDNEIYQCNCTSGWQDNKVGLKISPTLRAGNSSTSCLDNQFRIRKLTPLECWRLMGFTDEQFYKAEQVNSNTQLYKQAGNSIVVDVLMDIFEILFSEYIVKQ